MTRQGNTQAEFSIASLTEAQRDRLARIPDEEQRSVFYRELAEDSGYVLPSTDLSVAENALTYRTLEKPVLSPQPPLPWKYTRYFTPYGTDDLRKRMAEQLSTSFEADVDYKDLFGTAGVSSALESIALGLQLPLPLREGVPVPVPIGSTVLVPAPFWQGFVWSFEQVPRLRHVPVDVYKKDKRTFELTIEDLKQAHKTTEPKPRLLVLTNPHNPLGVNYHPNLLEQIYHWALKDTEMHIISDEMYCHSQLKDATPEFVSALKLTANRSESERERVHVVWGFAKDFGLSGFRAGFLISKSPYVHNAMLGSQDPLERRHPLSWFSAFDSLKHFYIERLLDQDGKFWKKTISDYQLDLTDSFVAVTKILAKYGIPFVHPNGGNSAQFIWLDLRDFLLPIGADGEPGQLFIGPSPDNKREQVLAQCLLDHANVKLLTGATMYCRHEGFFRLCFTAFDKDIVVNAVERMCVYLKEIRPTTS
jgi:aspartate/methionine/tyrosine aminotransferase